MAELQFFTGTMDSGKSTLALQTNHNHAARGRVGRIFTSHDRAGDAVVSSRLGLVHDAIEAGPESHENGKFAWIMDPDGNKVELWEPMAWDAANKP